MSLLDMILERELTPEQREARRARAKARREKRKAEAASSSSEKPKRSKRDGEMAPDAEVDITGSFIAKYWEIYNDKLNMRHLAPIQGACLLVPSPMAHTWESPIQPANWGAPTVGQTPGLLLGYLTSLHLVLI